MPRGGAEGEEAHLHGPEVLGLVQVHRGEEVLLVHAEGPARLDEARDLSPFTDAATSPGAVWTSQL